jgi:hypothetical protein
VIVALDKPEVLKRLVSENNKEITLEEVFLELTGKKLRSEDEIG